MFGQFIVAGAVSKVEKLGCAYRLKQCIKLEDRNHEHTLRVAAKSL